MGKRAPPKKYEENHTCAVTLSDEGRHEVNRKFNYRSEEIKRNIIEHASRRIDLLFHLMIFYYRSNKVLQVLAAEDQYGESSEGLAACHSSMVSGIDDAELKNTFFFKTLNACVELPVQVNQIDSSLERKLRPEIQKILNDVSRGVLSPIDGMNLFMGKINFYLRREKAVYQTDPRSQLKLFYIDFISQGTFDNHCYGENRQLTWKYIYYILRINDPEEVDAAYPRIREGILAHQNNPISKEATSSSSVPTNEGIKMKDDSDKARFQRLVDPLVRGEKPGFETLTGLTPAEFNQIKNHYKLSGNIRGLEKDQYLIATFICKRFKIEDPVTIIQFFTPTRTKPKEAGEVFKRNNFPAFEQLRTNVSAEIRKKLDDIVRYQLSRSFANLEEIINYCIQNPEKKEFSESQRKETSEDNKPEPSQTPIHKNLGLPGKKTGEPEPLSPIKKFEGFENREGTTEEQTVKKEPSFSVNPHTLFAGKSIAPKASKDMSIEVSTASAFYGITQALLSNNTLSLQNKSDFLADLILKTNQAIQPFPEPTQNSSSKKEPESPHKALRGIIPGTTSPIYFTEEEVLGDGNCGFTTLGASREQVVNVLLPLASSEEAREELWEEIYEAFQTNNLKRTPQFEEFYQAYMVSSSEEDRQRLVAYCKTEVVFQWYIKAYLGNLWLGYKSALLYGKHVGVTIYVWRKMKNKQNLGVIGSTVSKKSGQIIHMLLTQGYTHYNFLVQTELPPSESESNNFTIFDLIFDALAEKNIEFLRNTDLSVRNEEDESILNKAIEMDKIEYVKILHELGMPLETADGYEQPLECAAKFGRKGIVKFLLEKGLYIEGRALIPVEPTEQSRGDFSTPLHLAVQYGHADTVGVLLSHKPKPSLAVKDPDGLTALGVALDATINTEERYKIVCLLLEAGADVEGFFNEEESSYLDVAIEQYGHEPDTHNLNVVIAIVNQLSYSNTDLSERENQNMAEIYFCTFFFRALLLAQKTKLDLAPIMGFAFQEPLSESAKAFFDVFEALEGAQEKSFNLMPWICHGKTLALRTGLKEKVKAFLSANPVFIQKCLLGALHKTVLRLIWVQDMSSLESLIKYDKRLLEKKLDGEKKLTDIASKLAKPQVLAFVSDKVQKGDVSAGTGSFSSTNGRGFYVQKDTKKSESVGVQNLIQQFNKTAAKK